MPRGPTISVVRPHGEIDCAVTPALREYLFTALRPGMELLVIDLSEITFCDAAGLAVLVGTRHRADRLGVELRMAGPRAQMRRILRITGLDRVLTIYPTLAQSLAEGTRYAVPHPGTIRPR
ncbi:STAS domain-containing protein [Spiractinospora alimapuensis]|nr:STAS domain-containing protein [Spiractinospora alimapuensis]QVQ52311.1 STAS domain-containing protein [Spiractinospora alimapuensis]